MASNSDHESQQHLAPVLSGISLLLHAADELERTETGGRKGGASKVHEPVEDATVASWPSSSPLSLGDSSGGAGSGRGKRQGRSKEPVKKREQTALSCIRCRNTHKKCDERRPCSRCIRVGRTDCVDARPRGPAKTSSKDLPSPPKQRRLSRYKMQEVARIPQPPPSPFPLHPTHHQQQQIPYMPYLNVQPGYYHPYSMASALRLSDPAPTLAFYRSESYLNSFPKSPAPQDRYNTAEQPPFPS